MIINKINGEEASPNKKQNQYLLSLGCDRSYGEGWNGYGYRHTVRLYTLSDEQLSEYTFRGIQKIKKNKTEDEKINDRAKRLDKLTSCGIDIAMDIANKKIEYKNEKIYDMEYRDSLQGPSISRNKLIEKMKKENPLRRIVDESHAHNILGSHYRHTCTDYDYNLGYIEDNLNIQGDEKRQLAKKGILILD